MSMLQDLRPAPGTQRGFFSRIRDAFGGRRGPTVGESVAAFRERAGRWLGDPIKGAARKRAIAIATAVVVIGASTGAYFALRTTPTPDYATAGLDEIFDFTLLSDDFNKLPIEERLKLMQQLVSRLKSMSSGDSMMLGAFAAGIAGAARDQLEENGSKLAIDAWDKFAVDYAKVPDAERSQYLDKTFVEMSKMLEIVANGKPRDVPDEKRLEEMQTQVQRNREAMQKPGTMPNGEQMGEIFTFMNFTVGSHANVQQRTRGQQMMRDMTRHFRNRDTATGKPK
jgi:hypothetical protein